MEPYSSAYTSSIEYDQQGNKNKNMSLLNIFKKAIGSRRPYKKKNSTTFTRRIRTLNVEISIVHICNICFQI